MNVSCKQQMEKHISKSIKILFKKSKNLSYLNQGHSLPSHLPPTQTQCSDSDCNHFLFLWLVVRGLSSWEEQYVMSHPDPQLCADEAESQASVVEKLKFPSSTRFPLTRQRVHFGCDGLRTLRSWSSCSFSGSWVSGFTSGRCSLPDVQVLEHECHSEVFHCPQPQFQSHGSQILPKRRHRPKKNR